jgi:hypothetical protein
VGRVKAHGLCGQISARLRGRGHGGEGIGRAENVKWQEWGNRHRRNLSGGVG